METGSSLDRRAFLKVAGAFGLLAGATGNVAADTRRGDDRTELLVGVAPSAAGVRATAERALPAEARVVHENPRLGYATVELPVRASLTAKAAVAERIAGRDGIEYVESNAVHEALYTPNDPRFDDQYVPAMVHAPEAWGRTLGERGVTIAVVDTGVEYDHPDLAGSFGSDVGHDFANGDDDPSPDVPADEYHGTHVSGIAAGETDNGDGIAGIANATLLSVRALNESGSGYTSDIADGIQWATDHGADVINLSLGGGGYTETMATAVSYAYDNGVLLVAAAGNDYGGPVLYPAAYDECIAVSALDSDGSLAPYSNVGPEVEVCAPGTGVLSTTTEARGSYERISGTSMATPVVSGVAALLLSQRALTNAQVRSRLRDTAVDVGLSPDEQGSGRVDAAAALGGALPHTVTVEGTGPRADYRLTVSGDLEKSRANGASINAGDDINGASAIGSVASGTDSYAFSGDLVVLALAGDATISLNGREIDPDDYLDHFLEIVGTDSRTDYRFSTAGAVETVQVNNHDAARDDGAEGHVGNGGTDSYAFSGGLVALAVDGDARIELDGRELDPTAYPDHFLEIVGTGPRTDYRFAASGGVETVQVNNHDDAYERSAEGHVGGGTDSYAFDGSLDLLTLDGDATVRLDGRKTDPDGYPDSILVIDGGGPWSSYDFAVSGVLKGLRAINAGDTVSGSSASGTVAGGYDSYGFSGAFTRLALDGDARVSLDRSSRTIAIRGKGSRADYHLEVSGRLTPLQVNNHDTVRTDTATGHVGGGTDRYRYSGDLTSLTLDGLSVSVD